MPKEWNHSMNRWAELVVRHKKSALFSFIAVILLSSILGFQSFGLLKAGGYDDPNSDSARVTELLDQKFDSQTPEVILIADMPQLVDDDESKKIATNLVNDLKVMNGVEKVTSYYSLGSPPSLRSTDGKAAYFFVKVKDNEVQSAVGKLIADEFTGEFEGAKLYVAGFAAISSEINTTISDDLTRAESIAVPLTLLLLVFVFGSLVAAGLPMLVGGLAIIGSFFFVWLSAQFTDTSVFALNLITGMGLGLGIDYALLMVNRFREERAKHHTIHDAVVITVNTAGRTVLFSGLTVAIVLASLAFFPQYYLKSFALGGVVVVMLSIAAALIALPAMLALIGDKVNKLKLGRKVAKTRDSGLWGSTARFVMKRPLAISLVTVIGLGALMSLAHNISFSQVDDRILPQNSKAVIANNVIRERFSGREGSPVEIVVKGAASGDILNYTLELSKLPHIIRVQSVAGITQDGVIDQGYAPMFAGYAKNGYQRIQAIHDVEPRSVDGQELTNEIRKIEIPNHTPLIGGSAAIYTDSQDGIVHNLPAVMIWIISFTLVLMFLFTGSVLLPIKAVVLNILSLGATFGFLTWVFIDGNLKWLIGDFFVTGSIDTSSLVLIAVVVFGLSMDYELFLLSRIKEQHEAGLSTIDSVAVGLQRSGRIITAAALVLAFSFIAFATSGVTIMKMLGLGIAFAILLDATIIRALLVPALMRLFGELNWWAPKWMKEIYRKAGLDH
jgi:RND superfamily putative drug exporter